MFYIHILGQPPSRKSNSSVPQFTQKQEPAVVRRQQMELRKIHQRMKETYHLERRGFI
jgi:hypothetical protein